MRVARACLVSQDCSPRREIREQGGAPQAIAEDGVRRHTVKEEHKVKKLSVPSGELDLKYTPVSAFEGGVQSHQRILRVKYKQV